MEMTVHLPAHPETGNIPRHGVIQAVWADHSVDIIARDGLKPAMLHLSAQAFPWQDFIRNLLARWQLSRPVPPAFQPLRRIPDEVLSALAVLTGTESLRVMQALREAKILRALPKAESLPHGTAAIPSAVPPRNSPQAHRKPKRGGKEPEWG